MGRRSSAIQRPECRRVSRLVAVFRAPLRLEHRHFPRAEARYSAFAFASRRSDRADESEECESDHRRAVSRSENRRESSERDRCEGRRLLAISRRAPEHGNLREADRCPHRATGGGDEITPCLTNETEREIMWEVMFWPIVACVLLPW